MQKWSVQRKEHCNYCETWRSFSYVLAEGVLNLCWEQWNHKTSKGFWSQMFCPVSESSVSVAAHGVLHQDNDPKPQLNAPWNGWSNSCWAFVGGAETRSLEKIPLKPETLLTRSGPEKIQVDRFRESQWGQNCGDCFKRLYNDHHLSPGHFHVLVFKMI